MVNYLKPKLSKHDLTLVKKMKIKSHISACFFQGVTGRLPRFKAFQQMLKIFVW
ncbi:hypothetical protein DB41_IY00130 [Neochlamydia sp. TUME1]|nr:hypothetical protein DB41_IY00130 [Neochlamydia sp. TUME1]